MFPEVMIFPEVFSSREISSLKEIFRRIPRAEGSVNDILYRKSKTSVRINF